MMEPRFILGQRVKFIKLKGSDPAIDREINALAGKTGAVVRFYCIGRDEMPDLTKMFVYPDIFSYDIRLEGSDDILRGIPEAALEAD